MPQHVGPKWISTYNYNLTGRATQDETVKLGLSRIHWEGPHLILTTAIRDGDPSLFERLRLIERAAGGEAEDADEPFLRVNLFRKDGSLFKSWSLVYHGIQDRGFLWMDAMEDRAATEAVCLLNARLFAEPPAAAKPVEEPKPELGPVA